MPPVAMRIAGGHERKLPTKINFTIPALARATCPKGKGRTWLYDSRVPGLALMVTEAGGKAFYVYKKKNDGRPTRVRLGGFPEITVETARAMAVQTAADIAKGMDPMARKRAVREESTLGEVFNLFMEQHAKLRKRSWAKDQERYDRHLACWKNRRASAITRADVQGLHTRIGKDAPGAANRVLALLSTIYSFALPDGTNPAKGVSRFREGERKRFLSATELPRFLAALDAEKDDTWKDFFGLCLWTLQRSGNVKTMEWNELDLPGRTWRIPAIKFKTGEELTVPLTEPAMTILLRRLTKRKDLDNPYVFPSYGKRKHIAEPKTAWAAILKRAGITDLWIHDLRRTGASWMAAVGAGLPIVGQALGHKNQATTARYARLDVTPVRAAVDLGAAAMLAAVEAAKVVAK